MKPWGDEPDEPRSLGERVELVLVGALVVLSFIVGLSSLFTSIGS